jgi:transposase
MSRPKGHTKLAARALHAEIVRVYAELKSVRATAQHLGTSAMTVSRAVRREKELAESLNLDAYFVGPIIRNILLDRLEFNWTLLEVHQALLANFDCFVTMDTLEKWAANKLRASREHAEYLIDICNTGRTQSLPYRPRK